MQTTETRVYTVEEAQQALRLSRTTIFKLLKEMVLERAVVPCATRITASSVERLLAARPQQSRDC